ncbi:MAG: family 2 glycosyl transferase [Olleya sp.]
MKIGIIIIFHNNEKDIDTNIFVQQLNQVKNIEFCLVNNASKDNTYTLLNDINEACANVSLVNINTFKSDVSAVRAGARYMFNKFNLKHIGYVTTNLLITKYDGLNGLIKAISQNQ